MKNFRYVALGLLLAAAACQPKNEEVTDEQIETGSTEAALDTISNTRKDAVKTDENEITPTLPLPQPILQQLAQKYPGFKQPELSEDVKQKVGGETYGPIIVRSDFTNDNQLDYALQLQQDNNLIIVAFVDKGSGNFAMHELKRDILFNERGALKSLYYLYLLEQGEEIESETGGTMELENDALGVGIENSREAYVYENNGFKAYALPR